VVRDGVKAEKRVTLEEMPREKGEGYDVIYNAVTSRGARLRTIVTRPKTGVFSGICGWKWMAFTAPTGWIF